MCWIEWKIFEGFIKNKEEKNGYKELEFHKLSSRLTFYYSLPIVEKCLGKQPQQTCASLASFCPYILRSSSVSGFEEK